MIAAHSAYEQVLQHLPMVTGSESEYLRAELAGLDALLQRVEEQHKAA